jgi:tRNA pseudouridine38-40 synthase
LGPGTATTPPWPASSSSEAPGGPGRQRLKLVVAYLGSPFKGFAAQPGQVTVAGTLSTALEKVLRHPVELTCAGRTDAGVHAWGQVVSFDADAAADLARLQRALNKMLNPFVSVREVSWAPPSFDARRSALWRRYRYRVDCAAWPDPLVAATTWHVGQPLDVRGMQAAADVLLGEHDFSSFCHAVRGRPGPLVRRVLTAEWSPEPTPEPAPGPALGADVPPLAAGAAPGRLSFEIAANAFCHQMVRSVVGTLVEVGQGRRRAGDMMAVLNAGDRAAAGPIAPPHGLCLVEVGYPPLPALSPVPAGSA